MTDPRYLDATIEQIVSEFWARHYDDLRRSGRGDEEEFEDEDFDADRVQRLMEEHPDDWLDLLDEEEAEA